MSQFKVKSTATQILKLTHKLCHLVKNITLLPQT